MTQPTFEITKAATFDAAHYFADDSSAIGGVFDCSIYGTVSVS